MQIDLNTTQNGLFVSDLENNERFQRRAPHHRDPALQIKALHGLSMALAAMPESLLQEMVNAAIYICGADSAGVSLENEKGSDETFFEWVATAGEYAKHLHAMLPRVPSACGICLERGRPQVVRISQQFFDRLGVKAAAVTDGILLPWTAGEVRGTIWILAHGRQEAFDQEDHRIMRILANLAAAGVQQQRRHATELSLARVEGESGMAAELRQKLKGPLRMMKATAQLAERSRTSVEARLLAEEMSEQMEELTRLVTGLCRPRRMKNSPN